MRTKKLAAKILSVILAVSACLSPGSTVLIAAAAENGSTQAASVTLESDDTDGAEETGAPDEEHGEVTAAEETDGERGAEEVEDAEEAADTEVSDGEKEEAEAETAEAEPAEAEPAEEEADEEEPEEEETAADPDDQEATPQDAEDPDPETALEKQQEEKAEKEEPLPDAIEILYSEGIAEEGGHDAMKAAAGADPAEEILSAEVIRADVDTASDGCVLAGLYGEYIAEADAALSRINEIRREACEEGVRNPETGEPLTEDDYVPIKWSWDLEYIARIRAAESALTGGHVRTNGSSCFDISSPNGVRSWGEVLAWNWSDSVTYGIDQWYSEKEDWVNQRAGAVTGHYTQMIDPTHLYVGIGTFCSDDVYYYNTTAGEFSTESGLSESRMGMSGTCVQMLEMSVNNVSSEGEILGRLHGARGDTGRLLLAAASGYDHSYGNVYFLENVNWNSSDPAVVTVSGNGTTKALDGGTTLIQASAADGRISAEAEFVVKGIEDCEITLAQTSYTYDGSEKKPGIAVSYKGTKLTEGTDYSLTYWNNVNAGTATVTVTGSEEYKGSIDKSFTIAKASQTVTAKPVQDWVGIYMCIGCNVSGIGSITYKSSDPSAVKVDENGVLEGCGDGTVTITVTASGDANHLSGQTTFKITGKSVYEVASGPCGEKATWTYFNNGKVEIRGTGTVELRQNSSGEYLWDRFYTPDPVWHYEKVNTVIIGDGITGIGSEVFSVRRSDGIGSMSDSPEVVEIGDSVTTISRRAFMNCVNLQKVTIGKGLKTIGACAFSYCPSLTEIVVSEDNKNFTVADGALCSKDLTKVYKLPNDGRTAFAIPDGVTTVVEDALGDLDGLRELTVPKSVTTFEEFALDGSDKLTDVYYAGTASRWGSLSIAAHNDALGTAALHFAETEKPVEGLTITLSQTSYVYDGTAKKPEVTVMDGNTELEKGFHYTVSYGNNTNAGEAAVKIKGFIDYAGEVSLPFTIDQAAQKLTAKAAATSIPVGKTTTLSVTGAKSKTTWSSANKALATVSGSTVKGLKVGTVKFTVTAEETENYKAAAATVSVKILPAATTKLVAANQAKGIKLTWAKVAGANGYVVYRNNKKIKTITSGSTVTFTDAAANTNGTKYAYKVVAKAATGVSTLSKSLATYRVARPAITSLTNPVSKKMTVKWGKNAKASGYQIQYSLKSNFSGAKSVTVAKAATVSKVIGSLTKGKTYYVRIRTYKTVGKTKYYSLWSVAKKVKISK